ncbi:hypothetical protein UlMin_032700 [Ulmus minor]
MKGFMCHSPAATAVRCMTPDSRSVIVPRSLSSSSSRSGLHTNTTDNSTRFIKNAKYSRLVESQRFTSPSDIKKSVFLPPIKKEQALRNVNPRPNHDLDSSHHDHAFQVVVMRVALHCQGCAGKLKKHISKMEGVTSFSIELETKRVTVMGHISPVGVLESISKVKRAEFWPTSVDHQIIQF